jgi:hypothetical protein
MDTPAPIPAGLLSRILHVPVAWLRAEADAGRIPHLRAGTALLFDLETVKRILTERARQQPQTADAPREAALV